jgi:squalene cyclase
MTIKIRQATEEAIIASVNYILERQSQCGSWTDWSLPVGPSDGWVTAFVGYRLRLVPQHLTSRMRTATRAASKWLLDNEYLGGGWGYNARTGVDADSTSYGILFLSSAGVDVPEDSYVRLIEFQQLDGGFSTYKENTHRDCWRVSHPDVTPIAVLSLLTKYTKTDFMISRAIEYLRKQRNSRGLWDSFWWNTFLYSTQANLSILSALGAESELTGAISQLLQIEPRNPFETALLIMSILYDSSQKANDRAINLARRLIRDQQPEGFWRCEPILRLTKSGYFEPWNQADSGPLFSDQNYLFVSSLALEALCKIRGSL